MADIEDGFYIDFETKRTFFIHKGLIPPWVKSPPANWKKLYKSRKEKKNDKSK